MLLLRISAIVATVVMVLAATASPVLASHGVVIPAFARKYNISCSVCHAPAPKLTAVGEAFAGNGFEFTPGEEPRDTAGTGDPLLRLQRSLPLAVRFDAYATLLSNTSDNQAATDLQTPWVIKLLSGGQVADKVSYYTYFLLSERGEVAGLEDAYLQFTDIAGSGVSVIVGQFQVSDPLFKRELRLTYDDYQPYRIRVGLAQADLTYDRGVMALWSPRDGSDLTFSMVGGRGLNHANDQRQYDGDSDKNFLARYSQDVGPLRLGVYGYAGNEKQNDQHNRIAIWGPDATVALGDKMELNLQYLRRTDDNPFYGTCSVQRPCPGGRTSTFGTTVKSAFGEAIFSPQGPAGRLFFTGLYNWIESDGPVVSLRLGEQADAPGYVSAYSTVTAGVHYLHRRNARFVGEGMWDTRREQLRVVTGIVVAF